MQFRRYQVIALLAFFGAVCFFFGAMMNGSNAQSPARQRGKDSAGRIIPVPPLNTNQPKSYFGVVGNFAIHVDEVGPNSPAAQMGLKTGDIITGIDNKQFYSIDDVKDLLGEKNPGDEVKIEYLRVGQACKLEYQLASGKTTNLK